MSLKMEVDSEPTAEEKAEPSNVARADTGPIGDIHPMMAAQMELQNFLSEVSTAEDKLQQLYDIHTQRQEALLKDFAMRSMQLMQEFNQQLEPLQQNLSQFKKPLEDILLNKCISIPCPTLDKLSTSTNAYTRKQWGISGLTYQYNRGKPISNSKFKAFDLGLPKAEPAKTEDTEMASAAAADTTAAAVQETTTVSTTATTTTTTTTDVSLFVNPECISIEQTNLVLGYFKTLRSDAKRKAEAEQARIMQEEIKQKKYEQRMGGANTLIEMVPWLILEQAMAVLEMKSDNIEQAMEFCMSSDPSSVCLDISNFMAKKARAEEISGQDVDMADDSETRHHSEKRVLIRSQSTGQVKAVVLRVTAVEDDGTLILRGVLDRNLIPLDPQSARILKLSIRQLMAMEMSFVDETFVSHSCNENVLRVVFQIVKDQEDDLLQNQMMAVANGMGFGNMAADAIRNMHGNRRSEQEYLPISISPAVRDVEYKLDFDNGANGDACLKNVSHRIDGPVLFKGVYDSGHLGLVGSQMDQPIELYTQVLDDVTHNIVMVLINDLRNDISVDVKNISFIDRTVEDLLADPFGVDAMGRKLAYRIVVKDKRVAAVLAPVGDEVKQLPFLERPVPPEGSMVQFNNAEQKTCIAIVKCIPTGLIVTNDAKDDFEAKKIGYPRIESGAFVRKHVADLHGFIDLEVICIDGNWILEETRNEAHNVTHLEAVSDESVQSEYFAVKESLRSEESDDLLSILAAIESIIQRLQKKQFSDEAEAKGLLAEANKQLSSAKSIRDGLTKKVAQRGDAEIEKVLSGCKSTITKCERELRALRFEVGMGTGSPYMGAVASPPK